MKRYQYKMAAINKYFKITIISQLNSYQDSPPTYNLNYNILKKATQI
jgi:hypothetical protein